MKIEYHHEKWYYNSSTKENTLGLTHRQNVEDKGVRSNSVGGLLINLTALYLNGDYLKGGRM